MSWLNHHKPFEHEDNHHHNLAKDMFNGLLKAPSRPHSPALKVRSLGGGSVSGQAIADSDAAVEDDPQILKFKALFEQTESKISQLFASNGDVIVPEKRIGQHVATQVIVDDHVTQALRAPTISKKRKLDDDDYDDFDDDEDDDSGDINASPLKNKPNKVQIISDRSSTPVPRPISSSKPLLDPSKTDTPKGKGDAEDARKKLEEAKRKEIETVKLMSRTMFFTLENDRDAMLDQQRLDEAERRAEAEAEGHANRQNSSTEQGSLSQANLGASSLTLKNLIARIDQHRSAVSATESELRALMSEVRKNRSKWASEDKVGQEELYEAAEKVLNELKAQTEHSTPFLSAVKKKDAFDYYNVIKYPMDLGTMTKKLKQLSYKSKQEFVDDVYLIWANCLKYNSSPEHPIRKHALFMRKETDKLVPLIPEIVVRDRREIEEEERRQRREQDGLDGDAEESDDEPIMSSRGRGGPMKTVKGTSTARKTATDQESSTPAPESKPQPSSSAAIPNGLRAESEIDGSQGNSTPPPGILTPGGGEGPGSALGAPSELLEESTGMQLPTYSTEHEDEEYRTWKQMTKKERAGIAAARHKLFRGDKLNADEEALLRTKAGMRRWRRIQSEAADENPSTSEMDGGKPQSSGQTLAEGMEAEEESMLPDYYDTLSAIPDIASQLRWEVDAQGNVIDQQEDFLRLFPSGQFIAPESKFAQKFDANLQQIQDTRKVCSKIGIVKQMQLQTQLYQNQFQKYQPEPFVEEDISAHVMTDGGPVVAPWVAKAALQRSIGKIFFHAGFEEFQPAALDALTDMASDFFAQMCTSLSSYLQEPRIPITASADTDSKAHNETTYRTVCTQEEAVLHTIHESGFSIDDLDYYAREEIDRLSSRLSTMHDRMKAHLADLLRPALTDDTAQGQGSFNDGGEQFVGGDFAADVDEDFFGFRELGLDKEFGLASLTVPLHLLHNRLNTANQVITGTSDAEKMFKVPSAWPKVNVENVEKEIGVVRDWFKKRLRDNGDRPLVEDLELPVKQRKGYGRARVPATGKIGDGKVGVAGANPSPSKKPAPSKAANGIKTNPAAAKKKATIADGGPLTMNGVGTSATADADSSPEKKTPKSKTDLVNGITPSTETPTKDKKVSKDKTLDKEREIQINGDSAMMSPESL